MKLTHRNQAWKKWYRKSVARWRVTFTFTEKYSRPVTDFMQEWLSFIKGPPGPTVIGNVNG